MLYAQHTDGTIGQQSLDNVTLANLTRVGSQVQLPFPGNSTPVVSLLMQIEGAVNANGLLDSPRLVNEAAGDRREMHETAIYSAFAGLCLALLIYNFVVWLAVRENFQMIYCLTILSMLGYALSHSGGWSIVFPDGDLTNRFRLGYASLGLVAALALRFFVEFLEPGTIPLRVARVALAARIFVLMTSAGMVFAPLSAVPLMDRAYVIAFLAAPVLGIALALIARHNGSASARVLLLAWTIPASITLFRLLHSFNLIESGALVDHSAVIAMTAVALLSSLAMAMRIRAVIAERDMARADERVARYLADIDPLTGLLNRRALLNRTLAWQSDEPLRLLLVDVDNFKKINDRHGHDLGDAVLVELAAVLAQRAALRASIGRLGGEEFALIGTAAELSPALALAILSDVRFASLPNDISITVSIGMAQGQVRSEAEWLALYRLADTALYAAKTEGRNRVVDGGEITISSTASPAPSAVLPLAATS